MSKYFDKDFFKFFWGFLAIIIFSLILIIVGKLYQDKEDGQATNVANYLENTE